MITSYFFSHYSGKMANKLIKCDNLILLFGTCENHLDMEFGLEPHKRDLANKAICLLIYSITKMINQE